MPAYCLFDNVAVHDPAKLDIYKQRVAPLVEKYRGRYVVIGGDIEVIEGSWRPTFPVMIEFPTLDDAHRWYDSDEYRELKALRQSAGEFNAVFFGGL